MIFYALLALAAVIFTALSYYRASFALYVLAALLPTYLIRFNIFGLPMTWLEAMILILFAVLVIKKEIEFSQLRENDFFWPMLAVLIAATIAVFVSPDKLHALGAWKAYFVEPMMVFWIMQAIIKVRRQMEGLFWALGLAATYLGLSAIWQKFSAVGVPESFMAASGGVDRVVSFFGYPNALGLFLGPIIILFLGFLFYRNPDSLLLYTNYTQRFWVKLSSLVLALAAIVLAQSEGAILSVLAVGWLMLLINKKTRVLALILLALSVIVVSVNSGLKEFLHIKIFLLDWSGQIRRLIWEETWQMLKANWFWGAGLAGYPVAIVPFHTHAWFEIFPYPHNLLLNIWSELGLIGVASSIWLGGKYVWLNFKNLLSIGESGSTKLTFDRLASFVFLMVLLEVIIHGLVDVPYFKNDLSVLCWIFIGVTTLNVKLKHRAE